MTLEGVHPSVSALYLMHLISCALRGLAPQTLPDGVTWDEVFSLARRNSVEATCAFAVASAPDVGDEERGRWHESVDANLMRHAVFGMERESTFQQMDAAGIAHLPLKGVVMASAYPRPEMRWMCDNDILFGRVRELPSGGYCAVEEEAAARELRGIMEGLGYKTDHFGQGNHDSYLKAPFLNMEMHRMLANPEVSWWEYYQNPWLHARCTDGGAGTGGSFEFSREDSYIFHIAHMYKHFSNSGHGVRGIADEWVLVQAWGSDMDWGCIGRELGKLGMAEFEASLRQLAGDVVGADACGRMLDGSCGEGGLSAAEAEMLCYMLGSGTYGTVKNEVKNNLRREATRGDARHARARYAFRRLFPSRSKLEQGYPILKRHPWLVPGVYVYRLVVKPFTRTRRLREEIAVLAHGSEE